MAKSKVHRKRHNNKSKSRKSLRKTRRSNRRRHTRAVKRGGGSGNPFGIDQFNNPLTYSGTTGWYGRYPRSSDQILFQNQAPRMSYLNNLSLANKPIPGVNVADTAPLRQGQTGGEPMPLLRQDTTVLGENQLSQFYPGPTHY